MQAPIAQKCKISATGYIACLMKIFGSKETAKAIGVSERRVRQLIKLGILNATKVGRDWAVTEDEVLRLKKNPRPTGRPRKNS